MRKILNSIKRALAFFFEGSGVCERNTHCRCIFRVRDGSGHGTHAGAARRLGKKSDQRKLFLPYRRRTREVK